MSEIDVKVFLKDLAREVVMSVELLEPGTVMTPFGHKISFDPTSGKISVYCREYPKDEVVFESDSFRGVCLR